VPNNGTAAASITIPANPGLAGITLGAQALVIDA
jgi:hypothetical protein